MTSLKEWAMVFCTVSIIVGLLQMILPQKEQSSGIKLVMALYIVITILQPVREISWQTLLTQPQQTVQSSPQLNVEYWIEQQTEEKLQEQLQQEFERQGVDVTVKEVMLDYQPDAATAQVTQVVLQGQSNESTQQTVQQMFGTQLVVQWEEKERIS